MVREVQPVTVHSMPDVSRLVHEVNETGRAQLIKVGSEVARLAPVRAHNRRTGQRPSSEQIRAALAAAGSWKGVVDPEEFKRQRRTLQEDDKPIRPL